PHRRPGPKLCHQLLRSYETTVKALFGAGRRTAPRTSAQPRGEAARVLSFSWAQMAGERGLISDRADAHDAGGGR
ncbi:MAG: hypothetical protein QME96_10205, partial [Myxococcota bacterium]|nr:hypothetical protein [Myxococcota bacterium]